MLLRDSAVALLGTALVAVIVLLGMAGLAESVSAQEPTPTVTELTPPAAPDLVGFDDRVTWVDNSDNEDGFRIFITLNGTEHAFEVGEDVTVFEYPDGLISACGNIDYEIRAFNRAGASSPTSAVLARDGGCLGVEPEILPNSGSGQGPDGYPYALVIAALAGAGLTLTSVANLRSRRRRSASAVGR